MTVPLRIHRSLCAALFLLGGALSARAITVHHANNQAAFATQDPGAKYTGVAAYNPTTLIPPPVPSPTILTTIPVQLQNSGTQGMSVKQKGSFLGFSIEMSVTNQVLGKNSTFIQVPFLNLMANLQQRAGSVMVRVGGNTQESATLVPTLDKGRILEKNLTGVTGTTQTPPLDFTPDLLYLMRNISGMVNVHWFMGIPWFVTKPFDLKIVAAADNILGDYLLGLQAANEPDMYNIHGHRPAEYGPNDYNGEFSDLLAQIAADGADPTGRVRSRLIGPNIALFQPDRWSLENVWSTGFLDQFNANLAFLAVEKYPRDNCAAAFGGPGAQVTDPQSILNLYLTHEAHKSLLAPYLASTMVAQQHNKPFLMFETNTGSCGGFNGISDSFTAALWGLDYALQMAHSNFTGAMFHVGGQNVFYNPFTSPPTNQTTFRQWTIGPLYYTALVMAEILGATNEAQVLDLPIPGISPFTPIYGIYEKGTPVRVAIINYVEDPLGANDVHAVISIAGGSLPASVKVKYLAAKSVVQKGNITWAGQTFGGNFDSDGRPMGTEVIKDVPCDAGAQTCTVVVPAPGFALVFLTEGSQTENGGLPSVTFATTARTRSHNTATVDPAVLSTSNGYRMRDHELASTSLKQPSGARAVPVPLAFAVIASFAMGVLTVIGRAI